MSGLSGVGNNAIAKFNTEKEAVEFSKKHTGSEVVIKEQDGSFGVHEVKDESLFSKSSLKKGTANIIEIVMDDSKQKALEVFRGKNEGMLCVIDKNTVKNTTDVILNHPQFKGKGFGEPPVLPKGMDNKFEFGSFFEVINSSGEPQINGGGSKYEKMVGSKLPDGKSYIDKLSDNILKSDKKNLTPADVMKMSLDATNGDYALASLSAHNLLKNISYRGRTEGVDKLSKNDLEIVGKLGNLRASDSNDKMGPWYHFFGVQAVATITQDPALTRSLIHYEHTSRMEASQEIRRDVAGLMSALTDGGKPAMSPVDKEKGKIDHLSCDIYDNVFSKKANLLEKETNLENKIALTTGNVMLAGGSWTLGTVMKGWRLIFETTGLIKPQ